MGLFTRRRSVEHPSPLRHYHQGIAAAQQAFLALQSQRKTLAIAESYTGGLLAALLTEIPGSSSVFYGGICTYSEASKISVLGIDPELIATYGVVSQEVALAMAQRVQRLFGTDIGIATTGWAGPSDAGTDLEVGSVCWAFAGRGKSGQRLDQAFSQKFEGSRWQVRLTSAWHIFQFLQGLA